MCGGWVGTRLLNIKHSRHTEHMYRMPLCILLHLPRDAPDLHAELASAAVKPAVLRLGLKLKRVPTHVIPAGMRDLQSDEVLCAESKNGVSADALRCLQWAVYKRFSNDVERVHRQLLCDLNNGDESRVKRKPRRAYRKKL